MGNESSCTLKIQLIIYSEDSNDSPGWLLRVVFLRNRHSLSKEKHAGQNNSWRTVVTEAWPSLTLLLRLSPVCQSSTLHLHSFDLITNHKLESDDWIFIPKLPKSFQKVSLFLAQMLQNKPNSRKALSCLFSYLPNSFPEKSPATSPAAVCS